MPSQADNAALTSGQRGAERLGSHAALLRMALGKERSAEECTESAPSQPETTLRGQRQAAGSRLEKAS